jgi:Amidohydrolase family
MVHQRSALDLILRNARIGNREPRTVDIAIAKGRIADIASAIAADAPEDDLAGKLIVPGFVETHIHLDKSCILDRCKSEQGTLAEAIAEVATAKRNFTEEDVYQRARRTLEKSILQGTMRMRTHVEVDPRIGLNGFHAVQRLQTAYRWAIDIEICVFPQEGLLNDPGTEELLNEACEQGADLIGGCPYTIATRIAISRAFSSWRGTLIATSIFISISISIRRGCISTRFAARREPPAGAAGSPSAMSLSCLRSNPNGWRRSQSAWLKPASP